MANYDVIVVGAGPAGAGTALRSAMSGLKTLLIERGRWAGDKNSSFDVMWLPFEEHIYPGLADMVPQDKLMWNINHYMVAFEYGLLKKGGFFKFQGLQLDGPDAKHPHVGHICLRNQWDRWFAGLAVNEGVELMPSTLVVDVLRDEKGAVKGVITDKGEKIEAPITVAADGCQSIIAEKAGLRPKWRPGDVIVFVQMWWELGPGAPDKEPGIVGTYDFMDTEIIHPEEVGCGNCFTYYITLPNGKKYLMIGAGGMTEDGGKISAPLHSNPWYLGYRIGQHMIYKEYIDNARLVSMDCKPVPATVDLGCYGPTYGDGIMVVGDAGIGTVWQGFGVPAAWESAVIAADVARKAIDKGDASAEVLKEYEHRWKQCRWVVDAAREPSIHGKWNTDDGLRPFLNGLVRATPEVEMRPDNGIWDAHNAYIKEVLAPAMASAMKMATGYDDPEIKKSVIPTAERANISEEEKEWVGQKLSDKIKECVSFVPSKTECVKVDDSRCNGCGLCYKYCLGGVFDMDEKEGKAVVARLATCMECAACYYICPTNAIEWTFPEGGTGVVAFQPGIKYWDEEEDSSQGISSGRLAPPYQRKA